MQRLEPSSSFCYRGHAISDWELRAKVYRSSRLNHYETGIANAFRDLAYSRYTKCPDIDDYGGWVSLMQHYGLATRLLDWSTSVAVALYFAVGDDSYDKDAKDAAIWVLRPQTLNNMSCGINNVLPADTPQVKEFFYGVFRKSRDLDHLPVAIHLPHFDLRMSAQSALFTMHFDGTPLETQLDTQVVTKFVIPAGVVELIRSDLMWLGINKATLFPDLATLAEHINKNYH